MSISKVTEGMSLLHSSSAFGDTNRLVLKPESVLGAFLKFLKATISFVMSVCPSVWNNSAPTGQISMKFDIWVFFEIVEKIQVSLKSDKNNGYFTWRHFWLYRAHFHLEWEVFHTKVVGK
jgi:hypothetical protein